MWCKLRGSTEKSKPYSFNISSLEPQRKLLWSILKLWESQDSINFNMGFHNDAKLSQVHSQFEAISSLPFNFCGPCIASMWCNFVLGKAQGATYSYAPGWLDGAVTDLDAHSTFTSSTFRGVEAPLSESGMWNTPHAC
jgi:hypothetical protein